MIAELGALLTVSTLGAALLQLYVSQVDKMTQTYNIRPKEWVHFLVYLDLRRFTEIIRTTGYLYMIATVFILIAWMEPILFKGTLALFGWIAHFLILLGSAFLFYAFLTLKVKDR